MAKDTITVVMAVYNVAATITETIRSVLNQTYRNFTLLIIDDCSTDGSDFILKNFAKDTQFLVITHRKGTMEAANTVYGITMEENGISKLLSLDLKR